MNMPMPYPQYEIIAGKRGGIRIYASPQAHGQFNKLSKMSNNQNYWAQLIVKGITGLRTGLTNQDDVYVKSLGMERGVQPFSVILPGCRVEGEKRSDGAYYLHTILGSFDYQKRQGKGIQPGLHRAKKKAARKWETKFVQDGKLNGLNQFKTVGISDRGYDSPDSAAGLVAQRIAGVLGGEIESRGYDLFFTPGGKKIGGLVNYRQAISPQQDEELNETAYLLADVMRNAMREKNVTWFSEFGGSGILTKAMRILKDQNVKMKGHKIYLYHQTTRKDHAYSLSQDLEMTVDRDFSKSNLLNVNELIGGTSLSTPFLRYKREEGYTSLNMGVDCLKGVSTGVTNGKSAATLIGAAAAIFGVPGIGGVVASLATFSTTLGLASAAIPFAFANAPDTIDKHKPKF